MPVHIASECTEPVLWILGNMLNVEEVHLVHLKQTLLLRSIPRSKAILTSSIRSLNPDTLYSPSELRPVRQGEKKHPRLNLNTYLSGTGS